MIWDYGFVPLNSHPHNDPFQKWYDRGHRCEQYNMFVEIVERYFDMDWRGPAWHEDKAERWEFNDHTIHQLGDNVEDVSEWHKDNLVLGQFFAVWATNAPTEILLPSGDVYRPQPFHLIMVDNRLVHHRTGRERFDPYTRYFARLGSFGIDFYPNPDKLIA